MEIAEALRNLAKAELVHATNCRLLFDAEAAA